MTALDAALPALVEAVADRVVERVLERLDVASREAPPALLDRVALARELSTSVSTVRWLEAEGMPRLTVGESPRYRLDDVLAWLGARETARADAGVRPRLRATGSWE